MEKLALKLVNDIENRTQEQLRILEENFHAQRESTIHHFNQDAVEESNLYIEQELAELKNNVRQSETQFKWKVKKNLFIRREELVEGLFEKLRIKLIDYSKTEAYQTKLINLIKCRYKIKIAHIIIRNKYSLTFTNHYRRTHLFLYCIFANILCVKNPMTSC